MEELGILDLSIGFDCLDTTNEDMDLLIRGAVANTNCNSC
jgi:hypothetical protein